MANLTIYLNNNKAKIEGDMKVLRELRSSLGIKHPAAFFIRHKMPKGWDGKFYYLTDHGYFKSGLLHRVINWLSDHKHTYKVKDLRNLGDTLKPKVPKELGGLKLRDYQYEAVSSIVEQKFNGIVFPVGVLNMATNAGKTLMMSAIYKSYKNRKALVLLNDGDLYEQFKREVPHLVGEENYGYVRGKEKVWNNFTVAMVQTLTENLSYYIHELVKFDIVLVDEADLADNKTYKSVIQNCFNAFCRVGLSGTIYMNDRAKDKLTNMNLESFFGPETYRVSKKEMQQMGHSTKTVVKICDGNILDERGFLSYPEAYEKLIVKNKARYEQIYKRLLFNMGYDRLPAMVICQFKPHTEKVCKYLKEKFPKLRVEYAHSGLKDKHRRVIMEDFRLGKIDILVSSYIVRRGKNLPLTRYILNASGSDSNATISQIMGRGERVHEGKSKMYIDDLYDLGKYINRHSNHRINYYRKEGVKVILLNNYGKTKKRNNKRGQGRNSRN